jgi:hypothetical protein
MLQVYCFTEAMQTVDYGRLTLTVGIGLAVVPGALLAVLPPAVGVIGMLVTGVGDSDLLCSVIERPY